MSSLADQFNQMRSPASETPSSPEASVDGLTAQLEQMRIRMNELAKHESYRAAELNAAVQRMDDQLLHEIRSMAAEHQARRANILNELEAFAAQLNALPDRHQQRPSLGGGARGLLTSSPHGPPRLSLEQDDTQRTIRNGRYATR